MSLRTPQRTGPREWNGRADELAAEHRSTDQPIGWFDRLYAEGVAGEVTMPWDHTDPNVGAARVGGAVGTARCRVAGPSSSAAGSGRTRRTSPRWASRRPASTCRRTRSVWRASGSAPRTQGGLDFRAADLLDLPPEWLGAFDLVVEIYTIQAVPEPPRTDIASGVRSLVAPGGTLLAIQFRASGEDDSTEGPPFALGEARIRSLGGDTLDLVDLEAIDGPLWRAEFRRPGERDDRAVT